MARPRRRRDEQAKGGGEAGAEAADMSTRVMQRMQAVSRVALLIQTADALPSGPLRERLAARVDRMMASLARTPL